MHNLSLIKDHLLENLWCPICIEGGAIFYPRLRKNKRMKIFSLTNDSNFSEISKLIEHKLIEEGAHLIWASTSIKKLRLETELSEKVLHGFFQDEPHLAIPHFLEEDFPKDILNIDFSSQNLELLEGDICKELEGVEGLIQLEKEKDMEGFIIIYTTILNEEDGLDIEETEQELSSSAQEVQNIQEEVIPQNAIIEHKRNKILKIIEGICNKYDYCNVKATTFCLEIPNKTEKVYSIAGIFKKN